jgi:hypothetical protein
MPYLGLELVDSSAHEVLLDAIKTYNREFVTAQRGVKRTVRKVAKTASTHLLFASKVRLKTICSPSLAIQGFRSRLFSMEQKNLLP